MGDQIRWTGYPVFLLCWARSGIALLFRLVLLFFVAVVLAGEPLVGLAQDPDPGESSSAPDAVGPGNEQVTREEIQAALEAVDADTSLSESARSVARGRYQQALDLFKQADTFEEQARRLEGLESDGEHRVNELFRQRLELPSVEEVRNEVPEGTALETRVEADQQWQVNRDLTNDLANVAGQLSELRSRPSEISSRIPLVEAELGEVTGRLDATATETALSPPERASRTLLVARQKKLQAELEALRQEQKTLLIQSEFLQARSDLLTREVENARVRLDRLQELTWQRFDEESRQIGFDVDRLLEQIPSGDTAALELGEELRTLVSEFGDLAENSRAVDHVLAVVDARLADVAREDRHCRAQMRIGGSGQVQSLLLFDLRDRLDQVSGQLYRETEVAVGLDETRLNALLVDRRIRGHAGLLQRFPDDQDETVQQLLDIRLQLLEKLEQQYEALIADLITLDADRIRLKADLRELNEYINNSLFWIRSYPAVGWDTPITFLSGARWLFSVQHGRELGQALVQASLDRPLASLFTGLVVLILLGFRPWLIRVIVNAGRQTGRVSTDRFRHTWVALLASFLVALPIPLATGYLAWGIGRVPDPGHFLQGCASGLSSASWILFGFGFALTVFRAGGLANSHFAVGGMALRRYRRAIRQFTAFYVPAILVVSAAFYDDDTNNAAGLGRICFLIAHLATIRILWRLLTGSGGLFEMLVTYHPDWWFTRTRFFWLGAVLVIPAVLAWLTLQGYIVTAIDASLGALTSIGFAGLALLGYWLVLRWITLNTRRLAVEEKLKRRRSRAGLSGGSDADSDEVVFIALEDERTVDVAAIDGQTRRLLKILFGVPAAIGILLVWSEMIPLIQALEGVSIAGGLTLLDLGKAALVVLVTVVATANVGGLVDLLLLSIPGVTSGTRYAISRLAQYALVGTGFVALSIVLDLDWAQLGWIAAALSVGLGFGLQEVVANFVCGLILLFERPLRLGDIVTVDGITGTVTRIHMRATTITNWDRQEFVVPNKQLITGTLLNWTLSTSTGRVVIHVGVAYGTDTGQAMTLLRDIAADNPLVMEEPAPIVSFDTFGDSALLLCLRAYLPDADNRIRAVSEMNSEIDRRFGEAGIEIAFPQLDVHVPGAAAMVPPDKAPSPEPGKPE